MRRIVRTNKWHAVSVTVERNDLGTPIGVEWDIRINSIPGNETASTYLTPQKARDLADALKAAAKLVEKKSKRGTP